jgi:hypothetical protein
MRLQKRVVVGRNDGTGRRRWFRTIRQAEQYLAKLRDQTGVKVGDYYLDAPEELVNRGFKS